MSRTTLTRSATVLAGVATAGALLVSTAGLAEAATYDRGHSDYERHVTNGSGDADARAAANDTGRITLSTEADGGSTAGPLGGTASTPTAGTAVGSLSKRIPAAAGTYRIVFTYQDLIGSERDNGANANAQVTRDSIVKYVAQSGGQDARIERVQQLPTSQETTKTVVLIKVPNDSSGFLRIKAVLRAISRADGDGNTAKAAAHASGISFRVNRV